MLLSQSHRFIFIHIYKTAGGSITNALRPYCWKGNSLLRIAHKLGFIDRYGDYGFRDHIKASELQQAIAREVYDEFFKFAFIRNPWDWLVSQYFYGKQTWKRHRHLGMRKHDRLELYVRMYVDKGLATQVDFISNAQGTTIVDYVGRFEHLEEDFQEICQSLSLDVALPRRNTSEHTTYREYYDRDLQALVADYFARDIELGGYDF